MNTPFYIAKRLSSNKSGRFSGTIVKIAIASVAIGVAVMILALAIIAGFQTEISNKIVGFGSHVQIQKFDYNASLEAIPISSNQDFVKSIETLKGVKHIQTFGTKAGLIKAGEEIQGVVFKGVGTDYDWDFFQDKIVSGRQLNLFEDSTSNDVIISKTTSKRLNIKENDDLRMFFLTENSPQPRGRKFHVAGIYETGLDELDQLFVIGDIQHIRKLNGWAEDEVSGFEILIDNFKDLDAMTNQIEVFVPYDLEVLSIKDVYPQIFDWLALQDINVVIIIVLMVLVSGITMISTLLIIILERTNTIGILKALGCDAKTTRRIFLYIAGKIVLYGMLFGNIFGIGLSLLQKYSGIIKLPQESYYMSTVPILIHPIEVVFVNFGTLIMCMLMIWLPIYFITKISTIQIISYD